MFDTNDSAEIELKFNNSKTHYGTTFLLAFIMTLLIMGPFILVDKGFFLQYGDFNVQQYPFYMHAHDMLTNGAYGWDFKTDLGANFIGSYSFYNLGSPFFWLTLLFPNAAVPYLIGPLLAVKISLCAVSGYAYIRLFTRNDDWAVIGGLLYAFSGFSLFNIFFNHFHEPMIVFPLLLLALEKLMAEDKKGIFCLAVFINALVNYFFFTGEVIFVIIYYIIRLVSKGNWKLTAGKVVRIGFEAVLGLCLSAILLMPAVITVLTNPRVDSLLYGWSALLYGNSQRYLNILESFFFPPDLPARPNFTPDSNAKWGSIAAYLPVFGMIGVIAWVKSKEGHWLKRLFITLMFFAFIPILNSSFMLFNSTYYARWFYMLTLMTSLMTVLAFNRRAVNLKSGFIWAGGITLAIVLGIGLTLSRASTSTSEAKYGLYAYADRFWVYVGIAVLAYGAAVAVYILQNRDKRDTAVFVALCAVVFISCGMWIYFIAQGKTLSYSSRDYVIPYALEGEKELDMPEGEKEKAQDGIFRTDLYNSMDNMAMYWDMSCINAFHSIVPSSVMDFYDSIGIERVVATRPGSGQYAIRPLLSVKYLFDDETAGSTFGAVKKVSDSDAVFGDGEISFSDQSTDESETDIVTAMPGYTYLSTASGHNLWQNDNYIPMGFTYDGYITDAEYFSFDAKDRANVMLGSIVLTDEQAERFAGILSHTDIDSIEVSEEQYVSDCDARKKITCNETFMPDKDGFTASITLSETNLVFFSVPFEEGWSAQVNGEDVQIEKVNVGFMAVRCEAGENEIRFIYKTPGLRAGVIISIVSLVIYLLYVLFSVRPKPLKKKLAPMYRRIDDMLAYKPMANKKGRITFEDIPEETENRK